MSEAPEAERSGIPRWLLITGIAVIGLTLACVACVVILSVTGVLFSAGLPAIPGLATSTPEPTATSTPEPTPTEDLDLDAPPSFTFDGTGLDDFDSYEARYSIVAQVEDETASFDIEIANQDEPVTTRLNLDMRNPGEEGTQVMHILVLPDAVYLTEGTSGDLTCDGGAMEDMQFGFGFLQDDIYSILEDELGLPVDDLFGHQPELERVMPNESVNGVESRHYAAQGVDFDIEEESTDPVSVTDATIDAWVAREGDFLTRLEYDGTLAVDQDQQGNIGFAYELVSHNEFLEFDPPEDCRMVQ